MARRPAPPSASRSRGVRKTPDAPFTGSSRVSPRTSNTPLTRTVDVRHWVSGIRLSAFSVIMLSLIVLAVWVLVPTMSTFIEQRQQIAALEEAVQVTQEKIAELDAERERLKDPAYITTQARERLYYVRPGEIVYLIDNDLDPAALPREQEPVSDKVEEQKSDWLPQLMRNLAAAGLAKNAVPEQTTK